VFLATENVNNWHRRSQRFGSFLNPPLAVENNKAYASSSLEKAPTTAAKGGSGAISKKGSVLTISQPNVDYFNYQKQGEAEVSKGHSACLFTYVSSSELWLFRMRRCCWRTCRRDFAGQAQRG
jgi:hypothetical protein